MGKFIDNSIIPKEDNTSEIIHENLLKNTYITKRQAKHKNKVPAKYRNNIKFATLQLENEKSNLLANVNVALQKSKLRQDYRNQVDIFNLYKQKIQAQLKIKYSKKILFDLNKEIGRLQSIDDHKQKIIKAEKKAAKEQKFINDIEKLLFQKNHAYNKEMKELGDLRQTLDGLLKKLSVKNIMYDSMVDKLDQGVKYLTIISENASKHLEDKEEVLNSLAMFRDTNTVEERDQDIKLYVANQKLKIDIELNEFLQIKSSERRNGHKTIPTTVVETIIETEDFSKFMKHLIHISGETDLEIISENIDKMSYDKASLFQLIIFIENQLTELELSISQYKIIGGERKESINSRNKYHDDQLKSLLINVQTNEDTINSTQKMMQDVNAEYKIMIDQIYSVFKIFGIDPSTYEKLGLGEPLNEENMLNYFKEMEKQFFEILFKLTVIENGFFTELNEDPLMSDVESTQDLLTKDYNGIPIKLKKVLNIGNDSRNESPNHNIDVGYLPAV